jgi:hypothetical protein
VSKGEDANPRALIVKIIEDNPDMDKKELFEIFRVELLDEPGGQRAVEWYFFVNMYEYATTSRNRKLGPVDRAEAHQRKAEAIEKGIAQIMLLDLDMPNGKAMKDCTGAEMARFGSRFQKIADRVGKAKTVGAVLSEDQVKAIMK